MSLKPPKALSFEGNLDENYRVWAQQYELYALAAGVTDKAENVQVATFLHVAGPQAQQVFNSFDLTEAEKVKIETVQKKFKLYCSPKKNITYIRFVFFTRNQGVTENFDSFLTDIKLKARDCEFGELKDSLIRDRIVCGIHGKGTREKLLQDSELTLKKATDKCRAIEASATQVKNIIAEDSSVSAVSKTPNKGNYQRKGTKWRKPKNSYQHAQPNPKQGYGGQKTACGNCGKNHPPKQCPAYGKVCGKCHKKNHFALVCRSSGDSTVAEIDAHEPSQDTSYSYLFLDGITLEANAVTNDWMQEIKVENTPINFKLDTAAQANIIPLNMLRSISTGPLQPSTVRLKSYSQHTIKPEGQINLKCTVKDKCVNLAFQVVNLDASPILGKDACVELGLIKRLPIDSVNLKKDYADLCKGLGQLPGVYKIKLKPNTVPVIQPPRRIPHAIRDKVKEELDRMESLGVIVKQREPTPWVNGMVVVQKGQKLRICIDPTQLNKWIMREHHPTVTVEEVAAQIRNATKFTKLDARHSYWHIILDEESSKLCTMNTIFGRYRFLRLPFGLCSSSDIMQRAMEDMLEGIDGVKVIVDDILVWGNSDTEHDSRLKQVLDRVRSGGLQLNPDKADVGKTEVNYVGHILSRDGVKPNPERIRAVLDMPEPSSKQEVHRFLGMVTYLSKFIPNLSDISAPLRELLKEDIAFTWDEPQNASFKKLQKMITSTPVLKYYDVNEPITLSVDASKDGLGACILQDNHPVAYASRALTPTQRDGYSQLEKELLGIVFGCKRFHDYVYNKQVHVETDHKPLEAIFQKNLCQLTPRVQKMVLHLQRYDLKVSYRPGKELLLADTLSRAYLQEANDTLYDELLDVNMVSILPMSAQKLEEFQKATKDSPSLTALREIVLKGWPSTKDECPVQARPYWDYRDEIAYADELLFKCDRVIVPESLRAETLKRIHESHLGVVRCKQRARDILFWPGMTSQIQDIVEKCDICAKYRVNNAKEPLMSHPLPERPWAKVGVDLFDCNGDEFLVIIDYYSKFPEVMQLRDQTSRTVISKLKSVFARQGIPDTVISDNGPQFSSADFKRFAETWEFEHVTSSPRFPQSNGQAESCVKTVKKLIKKCREDDTDPYIALLELRNTPIEGIGKSPAQLLMSRRLRTRLPISKMLLYPQAENTVEVKAKLKLRQNDQKVHYDRRAGNTLPVLKPGDKVRVQVSDHTWRPAIIRAITDKPRSYIVEVPNGRKYRRNRINIRLSKEADEQFEPQAYVPDPVPGLYTPDPFVPPEDQQLEPQPVPQTTPEQADGTYVTRSGRAVIKPLRYR